MKKAFFIIFLLGFTYVIISVINDADYISDQIVDLVKLGIVIILGIVGLVLGKEFFRFTHTTYIFLAAISLLVLLHVTELSEEFAVFQQVPLLGRATLVKHTFETALLAGSVCLFLGGIYLSVFEINKARKQRDAYVTQLRSLASQLSLAEERERRRLADKLHDDVGQFLAVSKAKLDKQRNSGIPAGHAKVLDEVCEYLDQVIQFTRTMTFDLSPPVLYLVSFEAAVDQWLADEVNRKYGIKTEFEDDGRHKPLDDDIRTVLFRNVRELLTNVVMHARAESVKLSIKRVDGEIHICIEDDGIGFDPVEINLKAAANGKFGLFSIRERLEQLGGCVEIDSRPGEGSSILMTAPLKNVEVIDRAMA